MKRTNEVDQGMVATRKFSLPRLSGMMAVGLAAGLCAGSLPSSAQVVYAFTNFAGLPGTSGSANGTGTVARFQNPNKIAVDGAGNVYVTDQYNHTMRMVNPSRVVTTLAGSAGAAGTTNGTNSNARFNNPVGVAVNSSTNLFVTEMNNSVLRKMVSEGTNWIVSNFASGFNFPDGVAVDSSGVFFLADRNNHVIRKVATNGTVSTIAGTVGSAGSADGTNGTARFSYPYGVVVDAVGTVFVSDGQNHTIRKVTPSGTNWIVTTIAGVAGSTGSSDGTNTTSRFNTPNGIAVDGSGALFVADTSNHIIRKLTPEGANWIVTTIGGSPGVAGTADGTNNVARFNGPAGVAVDASGVLYVSDWSNHRISKGTPLNLPPAPTATAATNATLNSFYANWDPASGATNYLLDVSTVSNFTGYVSGYSNRTVGVVTTYRVSGLNAGTIYYYRVREQQDGLTSGNSATVSTITESAASSSTNGPSVGGNIITITGTGLGNGADITNVTVCGVSATIQSQTADSVTIMLGSGGFGTGNIVISSASVGATTLPNAYTYLPGPVVVWGYNFYGVTNVPTGLSNVVDVAAGSSHATALLADGTVRVWGTNPNGQNDVPTAATNVVGIGGGGGHVLALRADGTVIAWGLNDQGQTNVPPDLSNVVAVAKNAGGWHSMALRADGTVVAWGNNSNGQADVPTNLTTVVAVAAGGTHSMALQVNGRARAWGNNTYGATNVPGYLINIFAIAAGGDHSMALRSNGMVVAWGRNNYSQTNVTTGLSNVLAIAGGNWHSLAMRTNGTMAAWGDNSWGEASIPGYVSNAAAVAVSAGYNFNMALIGTSAAVRVQSSPVNSGVVIGGGTVAMGARMFLAALPTNGWVFSGWNDGATDNPRLVTALTNITYTALFTNAIPAPVVLAATNTTLNSFYANWDAASGATNYLLDVSTVNNFASYVSGYSNLSLGPVTTRLVSGLNASATYYYRVRQQQGGLTSDQSATASVATVSANLDVTSGPGVGGNTLTITGAGLGNGSDITNVTVCGITAAIQSQTAGSVTVLLGAGGGGLGSVQVFSISSGQTLLPNAYTYNPQGSIVGSGLSWSSISNLPVGLDTHAAVTVSNKLYVMAGQKYTSTWTPVNTVYVYDTLNPTAGWSSFSNLPVTRVYTTGVALSNKLYSIGGGSSSAVYVFDTQNPAGGWTSISSLPSTINCAASAVANGKIYVTGGSTGSGTWQSTAWVYDPGQPGLGWQSLSNMPAARRFHSMEAVNGQIYVLGGEDASQNPQNNAWVYDPALPAQGWLSISNLPLVRYCAVVANLNDRLYLMTGSDRTNFQSTVYVYDPVLPTVGWTIATPVPIPLANSAGTVAGGAAYVISGGSTGGINLVSNVYKGTLSAGVSPSVGPQAGGTTVTINGSNLGNHDVTSVTLGGVAASIITDNSPTQIVVSTGAAAAPGTGAVVVVSTSYGTTTATNAFTYLVSLAAVASPTAGGTVTGGGSYVAGTNVQLTAAASNQWLFLGWNDGLTNTARTVTVPATNSTYTANFAPTADVTVNVAGGGGGTVTGNGTFIIGSNALLTATASNGWWFLGWNDGSTNNPLTIVVASNVTYTANFGQVGPVTTLPLPPEGGATAGDGTYLVGSNATVTATASNNWVFMNWNGSITNNPWTFAVPVGGQVCTANFSTISTVTVLASPTNGGAVAGGGVFLSNSNIVLTATASNNWTFTAWDDAVTNNPRTITVPVTNITYTASFSPTAPLTVGVGAAGGGTVTGSGTYIVGTTVQLTATPSNGWGFLGWNDGSTNNPRDVVVGASGATYTADFGPVVTLTTLAAPTEAGAVAGGGVLFVGSNALLTATASNGWRFVWWNDGNTNSPRTVVVPATNITYTASFVYPAVVTGQAVPPGGGTVTGGGTYWAGTNVTFSASAASGWLFANWGDGNTQAVRSITVPRSNITYTANFGYSATLTVLASPASGGTVAGGGTFLNGATSSISATPYAGWVFLGWSDGNTNNPRNVTLVTGANAYTANFGSPARVGAAVNQPGMAWVLGGVAGWFDQAANARDGLAAQSGAISAGQTSFFQTTTNGPGSVLFWWKASTAAANQLQFYVGTQLVSQISGNAGWSQVATFIGSTNPVTLTWVYAKNSAAVAGADAGYVDQVTWLPCNWATNVPQLFFQEPNGLIASWVLNTTGGFEFARVLANTGSWGLKAAGDMDGDSVSDLLFQSPAGDTGGWFLNADGSTREARFWFNTSGWEIKAAGDYEGLGRGQLFFQTAAGLAAYWRLDTNGAFQAAVGLGSMGPWKLRSVGDLDGDLKAELFWQNALGVVAIWWHNPDGSIRGTVPFGTGEWALCGVADVDLDGVCDLIWQTPDTRTGGWFMNSNGTARAASFWWPTGGWKLKAAGR
jgi:hypothetical protein